MTDVRDEPGLDRVRGFDFFTAGELPAPNLPAAEVAAILADEWRLAVELRPLGSQQDQNFLALGVEGEQAGAPVGVVKVTNPAFTATELAAQDAAALRIAEHAPDLRVATTTTDAAGRPRSVIADTSDGLRSIRVISFLDGGTLNGGAYLAPGTVARLGELAAQVGLALADFEHDGLDRVLQWDPRFADRVVDLLAPHHPDAGRRRRVTDAATAAWARLAALADELPQQAVHLDLTDDNVVRSPGGLPDGLIDFGDVTRSWAVSELAITISSVLHHAGARPVSVLPAVRAFHALRPLAPAEIAAVWPLVVVRGAVLVVSGEHQVQLDAGENAYAAEGIEREWRIFEQATSVPIDVMTTVIADALGVDAAALPGASPRPADLVQLDRLVHGLEPGRVAMLDLSIMSPAVDAGAWLEGELLESRLAQAALASGADAAVLPAGIPRLTLSRAREQVAPATVPTGLDVWFRTATALVSPGRGVVTTSGTGLVAVALDGGLRLDLDATRADAPHRAIANAPSSGTKLAAGTPLGTLAPGARLRVRLQHADAPPVPHAVQPETATGWLALTADPAPLLGLAAAGPDAASARDASDAAELLERREASLAEVQEHYYAAPPRIERGWREHLLDVDGRAYVDMVNNVTPLGHGHVGVASAVNAQLRRLNTNSRFHYGAVVEYAERLAALAPDGLDTVFLVNSGSEATDLAIRIALAATGRRDVVAILEAYHGWTYASDAVSTSIADNPDALTTRPDWVHGVDAPNPFRGVHRGADAARYAPEAAARIMALAAQGRPPAAFIAETFFGNAGGIPLPDGYLAGVYTAVRATGGLAIADEVQAGFGRLGHWFWGFEQQHVVPDIIAVAKAAGNGYPLGAVITTREIAAAFRSQGYFFSSTGGSPASSAAGLAVLDAFRDERLQENALRVGTRLKSRLEELATRHPLIGAVHGLGLYLGVEFVRDRGNLEPATAETAAICDRLLELGVIMQPTGDHLNVLKTKPPLCLDDESADFFVAMLDRVLTEGW
ncbi:aminotransferase [Agromyces salentinus]|uniref:Aminotransferase n=1 Tax=Agromyces salentinus TaxID=269421 RepID=A0ABN2MJV8_9MICO|nr:aminotransferase [Agromyces salentinus]